MAELNSKPTIELRVTLTLNEQEARALALIGEWKIEDTIKHLAEATTSSLTRDHQAGLVSFLRSVREKCPLILSQFDEARAVFQGKKETTR